MKIKKIMSLALAVLMILSTFSLGMISITAAGNVCKIGTTEYATFDAAVNAAQDGDTITLLADATTSSSNVAVNGHITIDGAGHKLTAGNGYRQSAHRARKPRAYVRNLRLRKAKAKEKVRRAHKASRTRQRHK